MDVERGVVDGERGENDILSILSVAIEMIANKLFTQYVNKMEAKVSL